jgi:hypothetical protein
MLGACPIGSTRKPNTEETAMRQIPYAMRFTGNVAPASADGSVLRAATTAPSAAITAVVGSGGLEAAIAPVPGDPAAFESEVTFTGATSFLETGSIAFGDGNRLRFSTVGSGYLADGAEPGVKHGAVTWQVDGGEGQFAGARGLITSNFTVGADGAVADHHFGLLYLP